MQSKIGRESGKADIMAKTPLFRWLSHATGYSLQQENQSWQRRISRRDFLKLSLLGIGAIGGGLNLNASLPAWAKISGASPVVIVGGGLAGLTTAYRLSQQGIACEIYEASPRLGGRVFTKDAFNPENMFCELGGELIDTTHAEIIALCRELNVPIEGFESGDTGFEAALYFSEGKLRFEAEVLQAFRPLAQAIDRDLQLAFPEGEVFVPTYKNPANARHWDRMSLSTYLASIPELAPWLIRLIETAYVGEYGLDASRQSALNLMLLIGTEPAAPFKIFGESDEAYRIQGGNSRLVEALTKALAQTPQEGKGTVSIRRGHRLTRITDTGTQLALHFETTESEGAKKRVQVIQTPQAVLAIPFSVLRQVHGIDQLAISAAKRRCIRELGYGTNSKLMLGFSARAWRQGHNAIPQNTGTLFTNLPSQCYWETSRLQAGQAGLLTNFLGGRTGQYATLNEARQHALSDLDRIYGNLSTLHDNRTAFFNWRRHPFSRGSYSCPMPGQYTTLMGAAGEPELGGRLVFAGEHCSVDWMGFMNGAVESGNLAALAVLQTAQAQGASRFWEKLVTTS